MGKAKKKENLTLEERLQAALVPDWEQPYKIPKNWCWTRIANLCCLSNGKAFKPTDWAETGIPIVRIQNLNNPEAEYNLYSGMVKDKFRLCGGELLFAWSGTPGTSFGAHIWWGNEAVLNQHIFRVDFDERHINKIYFKYAINQQLDMLISVAHGGAGLQHVTKGVFETTPIPLPPLPEQQRIVDRIQSLFTKLDEAKKKAQDALDSFETRKAAILQKAFTGELTAKWRKEHGVRMESWTQCKLIDILAEKPRNGYSPKPVDYVTPYKSMTLSATTTGIFKPEFFKYIDQEIPEDSYLWLKPGDILIQRANSLEKVGMSAIYTGKEHEFIYPDLMMKLVLKEINSKKYIDYYLKSDRVLNYFRSNATGTAGNMPKINQKVVSETPLILPKKLEQNEIVRILDDMFAKEQQVKEAVETVVEQIDLIKKSILSRAFRGDLGTNDQNEESAVELLKRIFEV